MVCYGPRLGTIAIACAAAYALLHQVIGHILHIAGLILQIALITCVTAAAVGLVVWTVRTVQRRRAAAGACTTCRFRCQQPLDLRPQPRVTHDGYLLTPDGVTGASPTGPDGETTASGRPLVLD